MNKSKGFTLIETIVSIFIITLIFTVVTSLGLMKNNIENQIEHDSNIYETQNLLTYSKAVCKKEKSRGQIIVNAKNEQISFYNTLKTTHLVKEIKLSCHSDCLINGMNLYLTPKGKITSPNTINIKNEDEIQKVTIGVGIDTIRIKD